MCAPATGWPSASVTLPEIAPGPRGAGGRFGGALNAMPPGPVPAGSVGLVRPAIDR